MSHEVETMAYNKVELPWHGLGFPVEGNLTPMQMAKAAKVDWTVSKHKAFIMVKGKKLFTGQESVVRDDNHKILTNVSPEWEIRQNKDAFKFFQEYCKKGQMSMETAGSLKEGRIVWALAKINKSFKLFNGKDLIESYLLFTNPHLWGYATSVSLTNIRVVCKNTLNLSLSSGTKDKIIKVNHRAEFNAEEIKTTLGLSAKKLGQYQEVAELLSTRKASKEDIVEYFKTLFPVLTQKENSEKEMSKSADTLMKVLDEQPGANLGRGTWWQPYNAVTYFTDHVAGRTDDNRLTSAWFGTNRRLKLNALKIAADYAEKSKTIA